MNKRKTTITILAVLALAATAWAYFRTDPVVAEMQQLRDEMFNNRDLPEAERRAQWDNFRQRMDGLREDQRRAVWESGRDRFERFGRQRMDEFFQLPPAEQQKRLDEIIDRMQARQNNPNGGRGGWGGGRNMTEGQRDQRRKEMISRTDPKMRAQFDQFRQMLGERMKQRGVQGSPGGPWRG
ncbi:MAG: hypothetical protein AB7G28_20595 [Pirellulales bacterium]